MQIIEYHRAADREHWLAQIARSDWRAGRYLHGFLAEGGFFARYGEKSRVLLLTEGDALLGFCTCAERDEIDDPALTPWAGFVYIFPEHRGRRRAGKLLEQAWRIAKEEEHDCVWLSTDETGLYEKYGFTFVRTMPDRQGRETRVYRLPIVNPDYGDVLGRRVRGTVDRPIGSIHPTYRDMVYPVNYGYVDGLTAGDGEEQDVYILGPDRPMETFEATVIGVYHRLNDCEDKWIATPDGSAPSREAILQAIAFQEQYWMGELYTRSTGEIPSPARNSARDVRGVPQRKA